MFVTNHAIHIVKNSIVLFVYYRCFFLRKLQEDLLLEWTTYTMGACIEDEICSSQVISAIDIWYVICVLYKKHFTSGEVPDFVWYFFLYPAASANHGRLFLKLASCYDNLVRIRYQTLLIFVIPTVERMIHKDSSLSMVKKVHRALVTNAKPTFDVFKLPYQFKYARSSKTIFNDFVYKYA